MIDEMCDILYILKPKPSDRTTENGNWELGRERLVLLPTGGGIEKVTRMVVRSDGWYEVDQSSYGLGQKGTWCMYDIT